MDYNVGLDIGVGSVGWAVIDDNYRLLHKKGKNLLGVHLFDSAETAQERRRYRSTRRRLSRRRWRLNLLNEIFAAKIEQETKDINFFRRLKYSWVHPEDENMHDKWQVGAVFPENAKDREFHQLYPTIYHLRLRLMHDTQKHDLREVYMAIHHIMKYRGNFLLTNNDFNLNAIFDIEKFTNNLRLLNDDYTINDSQKFIAELADATSNRSTRVERAREYLHVDKKIAKEILNALVGLNVNFITIFNKNVEKDEQKAWKFNFNDSDIEEKLSDLSNLVNDDQLTTFIYGLKAAFDGLTLKILLNEQPSLSAAMVASYKVHYDNWHKIKKYRNQSNKRAINQAYKLLLSDKPDDHQKGLKQMLGQLAGCISKEQLDKFENADSTNNFLPRQRTKENGTIPVQLHAAELQAIIEKQGVYYPFLKDVVKDEHDKPQNKLIMLLKFRVPYYVGPMVEGKNNTGRDNDNHWMVRKTRQAITPWNLKKVIDTDQSAKKFINAMISTDTYLLGEPALAKNTLTYQKYNVLQELNNIRLEGKRLDVNLKQEILDELFTTKSHVDVNDLKSFLMFKYGIEKPINGLASGNKFNSNLSSYHYLKKILGEEFVNNSKNQDLLDEIITLQTIFEDKEILARQLRLLKDIPNDKVEQLANKHFTGWGRLSAKLLKTPFIKLNNSSLEKMSILNMMYLTKSNLIEILNDKHYRVQEWIDRANTQQSANQDLTDMIDELSGPRNIKKAIKKSFNILTDIQKAMDGIAPKNIYIEFARDTQPSKRTRSRFNRLKLLFDQEEIKKTFKDISKEFKKENDQTLQNDKLYFYYIQLGMDFYNNKKINIDNLSNYDIDHIIPQAFTKDNSLDNRVLVNRSANNRKSDGNLDQDIINKCQGMWYKMQKLGLISELKLKRLLGEIKLDQQTDHFIARQLVETRQIIKNVANLAKQLFPEKTNVVAIRAEMTSDMRKKLNISKNRDINDYHHAFDALLMATVGVYMDRRGIMQAGKVNDNAGHEFNIYTKQYLKNLRDQAQNNGQRIKPLGFVIDGMFSPDDTKRSNRDSSKVVFDNQVDVNYLKHVMAFKKILLTRPTKIGTGKLYKETQYKNMRNNPKKMTLIAANKNKPTELYGGFSHSTSAYMTLVRVESRKGNKNVLVKIPLNIHNLIKTGQMTLEYYLIQIKQIKDYQRIILPIVKLDQLVENNGERIYLTSSEFRHNAESLWLPIELTNRVKYLLSSEDVDSSEIMELFSALTSQKLQAHMPIFAKPLQRISKLGDAFGNLELKEQQLFLTNLIYNLHPNNGFRKFIKNSFKQEPEWPTLQTQDKGNGGQVLADNAMFIYQSPTGIFEKKVKLADLL